MSNILIATLGTTPEIIVEAVGLINHSPNDLYLNSPDLETINAIRAERFLNQSVHELWIIATDDLIEEKREKIATHSQVQKIRYFLLDGVQDISSQVCADQFHDLVLRVVSYAHKQKGNDGKVWLSLAGGRKTMSSDLQDAAYCFGCDEIFHILGEKFDLKVPIAKVDAGKVKVVSLGSVAHNPALHELHTEDFDYDDDLRCTPSTDFLNKVQAKKRESQFFYTSYYLNENDRANFPLLYTLSPDKIAQLKHNIIGRDPQRKEQELLLLSKLPKTELHCHLGGILDAEGLVRVAKTYQDEIERAQAGNPSFDAWCKEMKAQVPTMSKPENWKAYCEELAKEFGVGKWLINAFFILCFEENADKLDEFWFGSFQNEENYLKIGIRSYEALGDLQGSMLLQTKAAIAETMRILSEYAVSENLAYLEVRCSPLNYTKGYLNEKQVVAQICKGLCEIEKSGVAVSLLIIASRHGRSEDIKRNIELAQEMSGDVLFRTYFRGFDVAGDESCGKPSELRQYFESALRDCRNITIHAGETMPAESIWDAVYSLSAERIGHGLTLKDNTNLMTKFLERHIGIEMCPSSNYQIVGFPDNYFPKTNSYNPYPLKQYLDSNLKVCVNTDNPGISRTNSTNELHRAARLTRDGLSIWHIFQLIYNGIRLAFLPYNQKKELVARVENRIGELIKKGEI